MYIIHYWDFSKFGTVALDLSARWTASDSDVCLFDEQASWWMHGLHNIVVIRPLSLFSCNSAIIVYMATLQLWDHSYIAKVKGRQVPLAIHHWPVSMGWAAAVLLPFALFSTLQCVLLWKALSPVFQSTSPVCQSIATAVTTVIVHRCMVVNGGMDWNETVEWSEMEWEWGRCPVHAHQPNVFTDCKQWSKRQRSSWATQNFDNRSGGNCSYFHESKTLEYCLECCPSDSPRALQLIMYTCKHYNNIIIIALQDHPNIYSTWDRAILSCERGYH